MREIAELLHTLALQACESTLPCDVVCGVVEGADPLRVTLEGREVKLMRRCSEPEVSVGDAVLLLRLHGGQNFLLLDKAVKE